MSYEKLSGNLKTSIFSFPAFLVKKTNVASLSLSLRCPLANPGSGLNMD